MHLVPAAFIIFAALLAIGVAGIVAWLAGDDRARSFAVWGRLTLAILLAASVLLAATYCRSPYPSPL